MAKRKRAKKPVTLSEMGRDTGTNTPAATAGTILELITDENGKSINGDKRRRRPLQSDALKDRLSGRQYQAAQAIEIAFARVEALGSGGDGIGRMIDLQTTVDASPKPDATIDMQIGAISHLVFVMKPVPSNMRDVIEHLFQQNRSLSSFVQGRAFYNRMGDVKVALDLVANRLRY